MRALVLLACLLRLGLAATYPGLTAWDLDLDQGVASLTFDTYVDAASVNGSRLLVCGSSDCGAAEAVRLADDFASAGDDGETIDVFLGRASLDRLKSTELDVASSHFNSYALLEEGFVDSFVPRGSLGNEGAAVAATSVTPDSTRPALAGFELDLDAGTLLLDWGEAVVDPGAVDPASLLLTSGEDEGDWQRVEHRPSSLCAVSAADGAITLTAGDLVAVKRLGIGISRGAALEVPAAAVRDYAGTGSEASTAAASVVVPDTTAPTLDAWTLDANTGLAVLNFSEPIDLDQLDPSSLALGGGALQLEAAFLVPGQGDDMEVVLALPLKRLKALALATDDVLLAASSAAAADVSGVAMAAEAGLAPTRFEPDTTAPQLLAFLLEVGAGAGRLTLVFDEPVNGSRVDATAVTLQDDLAGSGSSYTLTATSNSTQANATSTLALSLADRDAAALAADPTLTFLSLGFAAVWDVADDPTPIAALAGLAPGPALLGWELDLDRGVVTIEASFALDPTTCDATQLSLGRGALTLSSASAPLADAANSTEIELWLQAGDLIQLKWLEYGGTVARWELDAGAGFALAASSRLESHALSGDLASRVVPDETGPVLVAAAVDMDAALLELVFDEPVAAQDALVEGVSVAGAGPSLLWWSSRVLSTEPSRNVSLAVGAAEMELLKEKPGLGQSAASTLVSVAADAVPDLFGNGAQAVAEVPTGSYVPDSTPPVLVDCKLDVDLGTLELRFDEPVGNLTLQAEGIIVQDRRREREGGSVTLSSDTVRAQSNRPSRNQTLELSFSDLAQLKALPRLAVDKFSTYVRVANGTALDTSPLQNPTEAVVDGSAIRCQQYLTDTREIEVESFALDMNNGLLTVVFSEPPDMTSLNVSHFAVQGSRSYVDGAVSVSVAEDAPFSLTPKYTSSAEKREVTMYLGVDVLRLSTAVATSEANTFLVVSDGACLDLADPPNGVEPIGPYSALQAAVLVPDTTPANLTYAALDVNAGTLRLKFNEPVIVSSFQPSLLGLQDDTVGPYTTRLRMGDEGTVLPGSGDYDAVYDAIVDISLPQEDVDAIKLAWPVASSAATAYVVLHDGVFVDTAEVPVQFLSDGSVVHVNVPFAFLASPVSPDLEPAVAVRALLAEDFTEALVEFDEPVDASLSDPLQMTVVYNDTLPGGNRSEVTLTSGTLVTSEDGNKMYLRLDEDDTARVEAMAAEYPRFRDADSGRAFLRLGSGAFSDMNRNGLQAATLTLEWPDCSECSAGTFLSAACSQLDDRVCAACSGCASGTFVSANCTTVADTLCVPCSECPAGYYQDPGCGELGPAQDARCEPCRTCLPDEFESRACEGGANRVCSSCDSCSLTAAQQALCSGSPSFDKLRAKAPFACPTSLAPYDTYEEMLQDYLDGNNVDAASCGRGPCEPRAEFGVVP